VVPDELDDIAGSVDDSERAAGAADADGADLDAVEHGSWWADE